MADALKYHRLIQPSSNHGIISYVYTTESLREEATGFTADDINRVAKVVSNNQLYILVGYNPITWSLIGVNTPAKDDTLGTVMVPSSGGLVVDSSGKISIKTEFLTALGNLPENVKTYFTDETTASSGSSKVGYPGINNGTVNISSGTVRTTLDSICSIITGIINKVATTTTIGNVKVPISGGINISSDGSISLPDSLNTFVGNILTIPTDAVAGQSIVLNSEKTGYELLTVTGSTDGSSYILPVSSSTELGGIIIPTDSILSADESGVIAFSPEIVSFNDTILTIDLSEKIGQAVIVNPEGNGFTLGTVSSEITSFNDTILTIDLSEKIGQAIIVNPEGNGFTLGTVASSESDAITYNYLYEINVTDWSGSAWTAPTGWTITKLGESSLTIVHNLGLTPYDWIGFDNSLSPAPSLVKSDTRLMKIINTNTIELDQIAVSNTFTLKIMVYDNTTPSQHENVVDYINITNYTNSTWTFPDGYTVSQIDSNNIQIIHNKGINPYTFSVLNTSSSPYIYVPVTGLGMNLSIIDINTVKISGISSIGNSFIINLGFIS